MHYPKQVDNLLVSFRTPQARSVGPPGPIPTEPSRYPHKRLLSCALASPSNDGDSRTTAVGKFSTIRTVEKKNNE